MNNRMFNALFFAVVSLACIAFVVAFIEGVTYSSAQAIENREMAEPQDTHEEEAEEPQESEPEEVSDPIEDETEYEPMYAEQTFYISSQPSDGLNAFTGVNYHGDRRETYYSSNVKYHQDTPDWTVDDEGFYRTDEGYYVVAASDKQQGSTFEGSKGTCIVLDSGCPDGTTDYYTAW